METIIYDGYTLVVVWPPRVVKNMNITVQEWTHILHHFISKSVTNTTELIMSIGQLADICIHGLSCEWIFGGSDFKLLACMWKAAMCTIHSVEVGLQQ